MAKASESLIVAIAFGVLRILSSLASLIAAMTAAAITMVFPALLRLNAGETKSGDGRVLPMTNAIYNLISACITGKKPDAFIFTDDKGNRRRKAGAPILDFRGRWNRLLQDAGLDKKLVHDFRRSAVRNLERAGVPRSVARQISGHKTESVYLRYDIVNEGDVMQAATKIERSRQLHSEFIQSEAPKQQPETRAESELRYN